MTYTVEDVKKLLPRGLVDYCSSVLENKSQASDEYHTVTLLLKTKAQLEEAEKRLKLLSWLEPKYDTAVLKLEVAVGALELIKSSPHVTGSLAREALFKIRKYE